LVKTSEGGQKMKNPKIFAILLILGFLPLRGEVFYISMVDNAYIPSQLTVHVNDTVVWVNNGNSDHTTMSGSPCSGDGLWDSGILAPGDSFSFVFTEEGNYPYSCFFWCCCGMVGEISVEPEGLKEKERIYSLATGITKIIPNPTSGIFEIVYELKDPGMINLSLFTSGGRKVETFFDGFEKRGGHRRFIDINKKGLASGVYFILLIKNGELMDTKKIVLEE
jgi:plastocyanin